eukprot:9049702-Pyramimonas_sp.AAC.1
MCIRDSSGTTPWAGHPNKTASVQRQALAARDPWHRWVDYRRPRLVGRPCQIKGTLVSCVSRPMLRTFLWRCGPR